MRKLVLWIGCVLSAGIFTVFSTSAEPVTVPVLAPITGFLALEGNAQRNGALLAAEHAGDDIIKADVQDTTTAPAVAVSAFRRALLGELRRLLLRELGFHRRRRGRVGEETGLHLGVRCGARLGDCGGRGISNR